MRKSSDRRGQKPRTARAPRFKVGERVRLHWGVSLVDATLLEDRGPIGAGGTRFYRIEVRFDDYNTNRFDMSEEYLEKAL